MHRRLRLAFVWAALATGGAAGADEPPPATADEAVPPNAAPLSEPPSEPATVAPPATAADGTSSVVVPATQPEPPAAVPAQPPVDPPEADAAGAAEGSQAADLVSAVLDAPPGGQASGPTPAARPLALLEALARSGDPSRRLWIAQAYWKVFTATAWVRWSSEAVERLELVAPGPDPHDRAVLDVATAAARADLAEARSQLGVAQQELVDLARLPIGEPPPWPVDRPLAGPYETHFDAIFATRIATGRTRAIARTLPARHEALESRAAAVIAAMKAMGMAEADHAKGRRPIEAVVAAHAAVVGQQREFLAAMRSYNLDIAEYAMAVADLSVPDDRFVAMLIGAPAATPPASIPTAPGGPVAAPVAVGGTAP